MKGQIWNNCRFTIQGENIPTLKEQPIKCLGKWYDESLKDHQNVKNFNHQVKDLLMKVEKSDLSGRYKVWCFQHGIIPRLSCQC